MHTANATPLLSPEAGGAGEGAAAAVLEETSATLGCDEPPQPEISTAATTATHIRGCRSARLDRLLVRLAMSRASFPVDW
jgi:hypothetical protein